MKMGSFDGFGAAMPGRRSVASDCAGAPVGRLPAAIHTCARTACKEAIDHIAMVVSLDRRGTIVETNETFHRITGHERRILRTDVRRILVAEDVKTLARSMAAAVRDHSIWRGDIRFLGQDDAIVWSDLTLVAQRDLRSRITGFVLLALDITERKNAAYAAVEERRRREDMESLVRDIVEAVPNGIVAYDDAGKVIFFNEAHGNLYGSMASGMAIGQDRMSLVAPEHEKHLLRAKAQRKSLTAATACYRSFVQKLPGDRWIQVQNRRSPAGRLISVQTDVTGLKRAEKHIKQQATRDPLTGLGNRAALFARLARYAAGSQSGSEACALLLIDLDDFKGINDSYGHDAGDLFLQQFAANLRSAIRRTDTAARLGGDEFAVILPGLNSAEEIAPVLAKVQRAIARPVTIGNRTLIPSASIGVACCPRDGTEPRELMKSADHALYHCKQNGRGSFAFYDGSMRRQLARRAYLSEELRLTVERDEIGVVLQPQRDMSNGRHFGFEALVRWNLMGKWIPPVELISIAEEAGLVKQLSYQVIDKALAIVGRLKERGLDPGIVAFNTVASQLYDAEFPETLLGILSRHGVTPCQIELELTENVILDRSADIIARAIHDLHAMGFNIALDDFGTGYASLTHLKRFPLNRLKIDRSFISGIERNDEILLRDKDDFIISRTIVSLAHNLGLKVVAEGVETSRQYEELSNIGCDCAQGYFIGRPMSEKDVEKYLRTSGESYYI
jgi:diguanylate cyclase (GGDEF)-like protein/PAS domain S-box-containing protein